MAAGYTITLDIHNANNQSVAAFGTGTYACSAALAFSPASALSSFKITEIDIMGGNASYFTISANKTLPFTVVNGTHNSILFNTTFNNSAPSEAGTTLAYLASARIKSGTPALSAGSADTLIDGVTSNSSVFTVSGIGGWRGQDGGRVWKSHAEHIRMRNLAYI